MPLPNPDAACGQSVERVQANIDRKIFNYFFRHVLAGDRGNRQALISTFFQKFYAACVAAGIAQTYDPDNESKLITVLGRLNFDSAGSVVSTKKVGAKRGVAHTKQREP